MLREDQIGKRKQRAQSEGLNVENLGRNKSFSDFQVTNTSKKTSYRVSIRGFSPGDNYCECPDFKTNTLGTCKHVEAVLETLRQKDGKLPRRKKAKITHPEIFIRYEGRSRLAMQLPERPSDKSIILFEKFFHPNGDLIHGSNLTELLDLISECPEEIVVFADAMDWIQLELEQNAMAIREKQLKVEYANDRWHPDLVQTNLLPYQIEGVLFLAHRHRSILADDMGLGKTVQAIAAVELMARERNVSRVLVVTPASLKGQWQTELIRHSARNCQVIEGDSKERQKLYSNPAFFRIVNYETVKADLNYLNAWEPDLVIIDEAQRIRNWESKTSMEVKKLRSRFAFVLTGTPLENNLEDLHSILEFVDPRRLGPAFQFLHDHQELDEKGKIRGYKNLNMLREKLAPILLRRSREEVLADLPPRNEEVLFLDMDPLQKESHRGLMERLVSCISNRTNESPDQTKIFRILAKLRLLCSLPTGLETSPKITEAVNRIQNLVPDHKVVVFSEWRKVLRSLQKELKHFRIDHVFLHGQMTGDQRDSVVRDFRENPDCRVFLSTDAGSSGLNLQVADTLFNLDIPWNPATLKQRISRIHRLGQKKPVQIFNLLMKDSIEEKVLLSQNKKLDLFSKLFGSANRTEGLQKNIESDILELVSDWTKTTNENSNKNLPSHPLWDILVPFLQSIKQQLTDHNESDIPIALKPALKVLCESILNQLHKGGSLK